MFHPVLLALACGLWSAPVAAHLHPRQASSSSNTVDITTLSKSTNSTSGTGQVAAAGELGYFGNIGVGCGINWEEGVSFGGGLQAGSKDFGLGGGYTIKPSSMELGAGIGYLLLNASASIQFLAKDDGSFELEFEATKPFVCVPGTTKYGRQNVVCSTVGY